MNRPQKRILITRLSHIGDCVLTLPMVNAICHHVPDCHITWAIESPTQKLLAGHDAVDEFFVVPKRWLSQPSAWRLMRRELKARSFDIAIDPQGITKSAMLGWLSGAPVRIGASGVWGRELSTWLNNRLVEPAETHLLDRSIELLQQLPDPLLPQDVSRKFNLPIDPDAAAFTTEFCRQQQLARYLVINPGASWPSKRWDDERFGAVGAHAFRRHGIRSVITWAGEQERASAEAMLAVDPAAMLLAPDTTLPQLSAMLDRADGFVGCDTGPLHIAAAHATPCIGIYGPTRPQDSGAWPYDGNTPHIAVQQTWHSGTSRERRGATNDAMLENSVADVCASLDRLMESLSDRARKVS